MKLLQVCLILLVHTLVISAKRRRVQFMNCPRAKANSNLMTIKPARSRIECSVMCLNDRHCLSASYCKVIDGYTCQLSGVYANESCIGLVDEGSCSQTSIVYPCQNGGTFFHEKRTCQCVDGFIGDYCHRRYRDCQETPVAGVMYTIQPLGSDYTFQWKCGPTKTYYQISEYFSTGNLNYTQTWKQMKQGIKPQPGYYFLGVENFHQLTKQGVYNLFFIFFVLGKPKGWFIYTNFRVESEAEGYACHWDSLARKYSAIYKSDQYLDGLGALGDSTKSMNGARFGTYDKDVSGCARANYDFAWWYNPIGCTFLTFEPNGFNWPTNRTGTVEMEKIDFGIIGLIKEYWHVEDDLFL